MKVSILYGNCGRPTLQQIVENIKSVLEELEIEIEFIDVEGLPYYKEEELSPLAQVISSKIHESKGVIAITSVHIAGMHSSMQSFFEHMERYSDQITHIPMLAIPYTQGLGERQVAYQMLQTWHMLGGSDGGYLALNSSISEEHINIMVEKAVEGFYRLIRQDRITYSCSEALAMKGVVGDFDLNHKTGDIHSKKEEHHRINLSTQEQNIQEFATLLKSQVNYEEEEFVQANTSTYSNPRMVPQKSKPVSDLSRMPHYFLAQHAKDLELTIQYIVSNTREQGLISIKDGDCTYEEGANGQAMLEITLTQELLQQLMSKKITYQKAFMVGKIKVKGNFVLLPKLDQIFKEV